MYCLHPDVKKPTSWRLQYKSLDVQEYFPFKRFGSKEKALEALKKRNAKLKEREKARKLRLEIPYNKVFDDLGRLKGVSFSQSSNRGLLVKMQITIKGKQVGTSRKVDNSNLKPVFLGLAEWRLDKLGIESDLDIKRQLRSSFVLFEMA